MTVMQSGGSRGPSPTGLADVIETILDKGMVIDAYVRVSLVGIEVLTIDARVVIASVDTYLRFAEAVNRLDISQEKEGLPGLVGGMQESGAKHKTKGLLDAATDELRGFGNGEGERAGCSPRPPNSTMSRHRSWPAGAWTMRCGVAAMVIMSGGHLAAGIPSGEAE